MITRRQGSVRQCRGFGNNPRQSNVLSLLRMSHASEGCRGYFEVLTHMHARARAHAHAEATASDPQQPPATMAIAAATVAGCSVCMCSGSITCGAEVDRREARLGQARRVRHRWCHQPAPASKIIAEGVVALQEACEHAPQACAQRIQRGLEAHLRLPRLTAKSLFHGSFLGRCVAGGRTPSIALPTASKKGERPR